MYQDYYAGLQAANSALLRWDLQSFEKDFAPLLKPDDVKAEQILLDLVGLGAVMVAGPLFNLCEHLFFEVLRPYKIPHILITVCKKLRAGQIT